MALYIIQIDDQTNNRAAGIRHAVALANAAIEANNDAHPENPRDPLFTEQTYLEFVFNGIVDSWAARTLEAESKSVADAFKRATPAEKDSVREFLEIPDVAELPAELATVKT